MGLIHQNALGAILENPYSCHVTGGRQGLDTLPSDGVLKFSYYTNQNQAELRGVVGFISTNCTFNLEYSGMEQVITNYTGVFQGEFKNDASYRPIVYTQHYKFSDFDAAVTSRWDGGGMWGYFVINKANGEDELAAHYVFQAGDHIGGTIDLNCSKI
jgi:hypothetical protein